MGNARRRGSYETRRAQAILAGRTKQVRRTAEPAPSTTTLFATLRAMLDGRMPAKAKQAKAEAAK